VFFCVRLNARSDFSILHAGLLDAGLVRSPPSGKPVTGGGDGFVGIAVPEFIGTPLAFYWFTLAVRFGVSRGAAVDS